MSYGWVKLHRSMFDNELWTAEPFTKGQAWIDLIGNANHKPAIIWIRGIEQPVQRGQLAWSELTMSKRWKWSRGKVRRYLAMLRDRGMSVQQTNKLTTILTICKYEEYQTERTTDDTQDGTTGGTTDGQQTDNKRYTNKNVKNVEHVKNTDKDLKSPVGDGVPFQKIIDLYHEHLSMLPRVVNITDTRKSAMRARWAQTVNVPHNKEVITMKCNTMDFWERYFLRAASQPFLVGDETKWAADFDFLIKKDNFIKVVEMKYIKEKS
jgi:hypothetical protein